MYNYLHSISIVTKYINGTRSIIIEAIEIEELLKIYTYEMTPNVYLNHVKESTEQNQIYGLRAPTIIGHNTHEHTEWN